VAPLENATCDLNTNAMPACQGDGFYTCVIRSAK